MHRISGSAPGSRPSSTWGPSAGRRGRLRFIVSSVKADFEDWEAQFENNPYPVDDGWFIDNLRVTQTLTNPADFIVDDNLNNTLPGCGSDCSVVTAHVAVEPGGIVDPGTINLDAPGQIVEINALDLATPSTVDACFGGSLQFRFTRNGAELRGWSENPTIVDVPVPVPPAISVTYKTEVRCSTVQTCTDFEDVIVEVGCPSTGSLQKFPVISASRPVLGGNNVTLPPGLRSSAAQRVRSRCLRTGCCGPAIC